MQSGFYSCFSYANSRPLITDPLHNSTFIRLPVYCHIKAETSQTGCQDCKSEMTYRSALWKGLHYRKIKGHFGDRNADFINRKKSLLVLLPKRYKNVYPQRRWQKKNGHFYIQKATNKDTVNTVYDHRYVSIQCCRAFRKRVIVIKTVKHEIVVWYYFV